MATIPARVLIIGGHSSIARHLLALLPDSRALARNGGGIGITAIGDYRNVKPRDMADAKVVINCAGIVTGNDVTLRAINTDLQAKLATTAREAGAERYIAIGSFSIFGAPTRIDRNNVTAPADAYGRSKRDGDLALSRLQTDRFGTLSIALPAIVGTTRAGKVERMLRLWRRTGFWPVPAHDVERSMIGARGAACVLASAVDDDCTGRVLASDPTPFRYRTVAEWLRQDVGGTFARLTVPKAGTTLLARVAPTLHRSLMADSLLDPGSNYAVVRNVESTLRQELAAAVMREER